MPELVHQTVTRALLQTLALGTWRVGQKLPTERTLASDMGCAVGTLRRALSELEHAGLVERVQGRGTFVKALPKDAAYPLFHLVLTRGGGAPSARVLERGVSPCPVALPQARHLKRARYLDGVLVAFENIWVSLNREFGDDEGDNALYQQLAERLGVWILRVEDRISVVHRDAALPQAWPEYCGWVVRHSYDAQGHWVEYSETTFNPSVAVYRAHWEK